MDLRRALSFDRWTALTDDEARAAARAVEAAVPRARFVALEGRVAVFDVDGVEMVLVPGGRVTLGFDPTQLDVTAVAAWQRSFEGDGGHVAQQVIAELTGVQIEEERPKKLLEFVAASLSPRRTVELAPFLLERSSDAVLARERHDASGDDDPHVSMARAVVGSGFRLPSADEWEWASSGGDRTLFRWGNSWPVETDVWEGVGFDGHARPNAFGLRFGTNPYHSEIVDDPEQLHGGDGGCLVCGDTGPMAWITFANAYRYRLGVTDDRETWFEQAHPRRALSIFPRDGEGAIREYRAPTVRDNAELAAATLREVLADHDGLVLEDDERDELREELGELAEIRAAHPNDATVQACCARAYRKLGELDDAEACARRAVALERSFDTLTALAAVYRVEGNVDEAVELFDEVSRLDPDDTTSLAEGGDVLRFASRFAEAAKRYEEALRRDPSHGWAQVMLALVRFRMTGDRTHAASIVEIARGPAAGVDWVEEVADDVSPGWRGRKKSPPTKKAAPAKKKAAPSKKRAAPAKKAATKKAATKRNVTKKAATKKAAKLRR